MHMTKLNRLQYYYLTAHRGDHEEKGVTSLLSLLISLGDENGISPEELYSMSQSRMRMFIPILVTW